MRMRAAGGWMGWGVPYWGADSNRNFSALMKRWWRAVGRRGRIGIELCWNYNFQGMHTDQLGVEVSLLSTTMDSIIAIDRTSL